MNHDQLIANLGFFPGVIPEASRKDAALDYLTELCRRDWTVRVLDAWAEKNDETWASNETLITLTNRAYVGDRHWYGAPDVARQAAALSVFPTLSADKQAELGECP